MKKPLVVGLVLLILVLDWAALDDIATGKEPSFLEEYLTIIISLPLLLGIGYLIFRSKNR